MNEKELIIKVKQELENNEELYIACRSEKEEIIKNLNIETLKNIGKENGIFVKRFNETKTKKKTYAKEYEKNKLIGFSKYDF